MTTQTLYEITATNFADCSGDSILAPLTGAEFMYGREAKAEYNEMMRNHVERDDKTMGNSCLMQARKTDKKVAFRAPEWAEKVSVEKLKSKGVDLLNPYENFWYIELGGMIDTIEQAEVINQRLLALCLGIWDTIKNSGQFDADYFELEFLGFLGAKRESRRMRGDYVLTANDIVEHKEFSDVVAYGGWPLDDHNPEGFDGKESNYVIDVGKPYEIPYRCLYSRNIENLFFAGRNISLTHMAMSSARVMGTCSILGQAVGGAAWIAKKYGVTPREVSNYILELQQLLLKEDCYLPRIERQVSKKCKQAELQQKYEVLRNGKDRNLEGKENKMAVKNGEAIVYKFKESTYVKEVKIVFDSDLLRESYDVAYCEKQHSMRCNILDDSPTMDLPKTLAKRYEISAITADGSNVKLLIEKENKKRNVLLKVEKEVKQICLTVFENWGGTDSTNIFTFELCD